MTDPSGGFRHLGIGGSEAAAVLGVSPWMSRLGLWQLKRGLRQSDPPSERMRWGTRLEPVIIAAYEEERGVTVNRYPESVVHPSYTFMRGIPDGWTADRLIEVKAIGRLSDDWGPDGTDQVPAHYFAQVQHYMALTDEILCDVVALVGGNELHTWTVPRDPPFIAALIEQERDFWASVESGTPPSPDGSEDARRALRAMYPQAERDEIAADDDTRAAMLDYVEARMMRSGYEEQQELAAQRIMAYMGDHAHLVGDGFRADWTNIAGRTDWALVAKAFRHYATEMAKHWNISGWIGPGEPGGPDLTIDEALDALVTLHTAGPSRRLTVKGGKA